MLGSVHMAFDPSEDANGIPEEANLISSEGRAQGLWSPRDPLQSLHPMEPARRIRPHLQAERRRSITTRRSRILATIFADSGAVPRLRVLSRRRPSTPSSPYRRCQRQTAGRLTPAQRATSRTGERSAEKRTIFARWTCLSGRLRSPMMRSRRSRFSAGTLTLTV